MKTILFLLIISFLTIEGKAQTRYTAPKGYAIYKDYDNKPFQLNKDLDGDGINDLVIVYAKNKTEDEKISGSLFKYIIQHKQNLLLFPIQF
jgi:hypothetical protein